MKKLFNKYLFSVILLFFASIISWYTFRPFLVRYLVQKHQEGVVIELKKIADEYSDIQTSDKGMEAIKMIEYLKNYYVVNADYSSGTEMDIILEKQRKITIDALFKGLRTFTGKDFGEDLSKWENVLRGLNKTTTNQHENCD